jgi:uncharacterized membrane protein YeiH
MDVVGATTVAFVTAFGGGTLRDLLLGRTPIFWLTDPWLSITTFAISIISFYLVDRVSSKLLLIPDALGLGIFSILGATFALNMHLSLLITSLMGVVTGYLAVSFGMCFVTKSRMSSKPAQNFTPPAPSQGPGFLSFSLF